MPRKRKPRKLKLYIALALFGVVCAALGLHIHLSLQPERNDVTINLNEADWPKGALRVAVLGDLHLAEDESDYKDTEALLNEVKSAGPDLVVFVGDYTAHRDKVLDIDVHRRRILKLLKTVSPIHTQLFLVITKHTHGITAGSGKRLIRTSMSSIIRFK